MIMKQVMKKTLTFSGVLVSAWAVKEFIKMDPKLYGPLSAFFRQVEEKRSSLFHRYRKEQLFSLVGGDVVEINAGSGNTFNYFGPDMSDYICNEENSHLHDTIFATAKDRGFTSLRVIETDALSMLKNLDSASKDAIIFNSALQFEQDPQTIIKESFRVLKQGGKIFFVEPTIPTAFFNVFSQAHAFFDKVMFNKHVKDIVPLLVDDAMYVNIQDWSTPGNINDQFSQVKPLITPETLTPEGRADQFTYNLGLLSVLFSTRRLVAGYVTKDVDIFTQTDVNRDFIKGILTGGFSKPSYRVLKMNEEAKACQEDAIRQNFFMKRQFMMMKARQGQMTPVGKGFPEDVPL